MASFILFLVRKQSLQKPFILNNLFVSFYCFQKKKDCHTLKVLRKTNGSFKFWKTSGRLREIQGNHDILTSFFSIQGDSGYY